MKRFSSFLLGFIVASALFLIVFKTGPVTSDYSGVRLDMPTQTGSTQVPNRLEKPTSKATGEQTATPTIKPTLTPTSTPCPTAQIGDRGEAVEQIQTRLKELGYYRSSVDGAYGNITAKAVAAFQKDRWLDNTGDVNSATSRMLFSRFAKTKDEINSDKVTVNPQNTKSVKTKKSQSELFPEYRDSVTKGMRYVLNKNTRKFHRASCRHVKTIKPKNYKEYSGSREDVIAMGYAPCKVCSP